MNGKVGGGGRGRGEGVTGEKWVHGGRLERKEGSLGVVPFCVTQIEKGCVDSAGENRSGVTTLRLSKLCGWGMLFTEFRTSCLWQLGIKICRDMERIGVAEKECL